MKDYFNKSDRQSHSQAIVLAFFIKEWLDSTKALTGEEIKYLKTATTYLFKAHDLLKARLGNKYTKTLHNDLKAMGEEIGTTETYVSVDDMLENMANADVKLLAECVRSLKCKNCVQADYLACNEYHIFLRNGIEGEENQGCIFGGTK